MYGDLCWWRSNAVTCTAYSQLVLASWHHTAMLMSSTSMPRCTTRLDRLLFQNSTKKLMVGGAQHSISKAQANNHTVSKARPCSVEILTRHSQTPFVWEWAYILALNSGSSCPTCLTACAGCIKGTLFLKLVSDIPIPTPARVSILPCTPLMSGTKSVAYGGMAHQLVIFQMLRNCYILSYLVLKNTIHFQAASVSLSLAGPTPVSKAQQIIN